VKKYKTPELELETLNLDVLGKKGPWRVGSQGDGIWLPVGGEFQHEIVAEQFRDAVEAAYAACRRFDQEGCCCPECDAWSYAPLGAISTLLGWSSFSRDGVEHHHDPNTYCAHYFCPNGHEFVRTFYKPCPRCGEVSKPDDIRTATQQNREGMRENMRSFPATEFDMQWFRKCTGEDLA